MGFRGSGVQISASRPSFYRRREAAIPVSVTAQALSPAPPNLRVVDGGPGTAELQLGIVRSLSVSVPGETSLTYMVDVRLGQRISLREMSRNINTQVPGTFTGFLGS